MTEPSSGFAVYVLAQLRVAAARARLTAVEAKSIGAALNGNFVCVDDALSWAHDTGVLDLNAPDLTHVSTS